MRPEINELSAVPGPGQCSVQVTTTHPREERLERRSVFSPSWPGTRFQRSAIATQSWLFSFGIPAAGEKLAGDCTIMASPNQIECPLGCKAVFALTAFHVRRRGSVTLRYSFFLSFVCGLRNTAPSNARSLKYPVQIVLQASCVAVLVSIYVNASLV